MVQNKPLTLFLGDPLSWSVRAAATQRQRRQLGDVTGDQLFAQLGVGGPQFAITDPQLGQLDAQRPHCCCATRIASSIFFSILTKLEEISSMISLRRRDDLPARTRRRIVRALAQFSSAPSCSKKSGVHHGGPATWAVSGRGDTWPPAAFLAERSCVESNRLD